MEATQAIATAPPAAGFVAVFALPKKSTIINLRWPLVILCSYLILFSWGGWFDPFMAHGFLLFYILSNVTLYMVDEELFASASFYTPLVLFDTLALTASLTLSGQIGSDFYIAYFLTMILCVICKDLRGLMLIAFLAPLVYGHFLFQHSQVHDPSLYLRVPFPFVVALFYGYFAQLENHAVILKEEQESEAERKRNEEQAQRHRERIRALGEMDLAITSTLDLRAVLDVLLEKADQVLTVPAIMTLRLLHPEKGSLETVAFRNISAQVWKEDHAEGGQGLSRAVLENKVPVLVVDALADPRTTQRNFFLKHGLVSFIGLPLMAKGEFLGDLSIFTKSAYSGASEEIEFLSMLVRQAAIAIQNAKLYEQTRQQAVEMERLNRAREVFLGLMSHELRTPLNVIVGYTGMLQDRMLGELNPEQEKVLQRVLTHSSDLLAMIVNLFQAATLESEAIRLKRDRIQVSDFLDQLRRAWHLPLGKELNLLWDYPSQLPAMETDGAKLRIVLEGLIENAIKFTDRGTVSIAARIVESGEGNPHVGAEDQGAGVSSGPRFVEFKVADTGVGIPEDAMSVIFEKFRQAESPDTRSYRGLGLGLYIASKLTGMLGGKIEVKSQPERGSVFTVTLPLSLTS